MNSFQAESEDILPLQIGIYLYKTDFVRLIIACIKKHQAKSTGTLDFNF